MFNYVFFFFLNKCDSWVLHDKWSGRFCQVCQIQIWIFSLRVFEDCSYQTSYTISSLASMSQSPLLAFIFILCLCTVNQLITFACSTQRCLIFVMKDVLSKICQNFFVYCRERNGTMIPQGRKKLQIKDWKQLTFSCLFILVCVCFSASGY